MTARVQPGVDPGRSQQGGWRARPDVRPRYLDVEPRHARRHDRQQLVRRALGALRHDDRSRRVARCRAVRREPSAARARSTHRRSRGAVRATRWRRVCIATFRVSSHEHETAIRRDFPPFWRKSGGYRLERMVPDAGPFNLANLVVGSEGTLAVVVEASVRLVPQPKAVVGVAGHFETVAAAIAAAEDARECDAAVIELVDRFILNLARRSAAHGKLVSVLDGDPGALLWLEFYGDTLAEARASAERLEAMWRANGHGYAVLRAETSDAAHALSRAAEGGARLAQRRGRARRAIGRVRRRHCRRSGAARRIHAASCRAARATRAQGRVLRSCVGRLSPHPAVHGSDEAGRRRDAARGCGRGVRAGHGVRRHEQQRARRWSRAQRVQSHGFSATSCTARCARSSSSSIRTAGSIRARRWTRRA